MLFKKVYQNSAVTVQTLTEKSLLSKNIYNKFFIRSSLAKVKTIKVLDNGSNFFHISVKSKPAVFFKKSSSKKKCFNGSLILWEKSSLY